MPDGLRGPDAALVAKLDELKWSIHFEPWMLPGRDPPEGMPKTKE